MPKDLTVREVAGLRRVGQHRVSRSLYLQVTPTGTRSWLFRYKVNDTPRWMGLGPFDLVTLAEAREQALDCRRLLRNGVDPLEQKRAAKAKVRLASASDLTFETCAERYIDAHQAGWRNGKHRAQWRSSLATYVYPALGKLPVQTIDTARVLQALEPIWHTKTETASRVRGRIESVLDWAAVRGYRTGDNPARWRGHLEALLPARAKVAPVKHHKALPYAEVPAFMAKLRQQDGTAARCLEFIILTATRSGEARLARWSEIDLQAKTWTLSAERMKAKREHVVPLSGRALEILAGLPGAGDQHCAGDLLFEGRRVGRPIANDGPLIMARDLGVTGLTSHGFRSTFRDWAAEQTDYPNHVVEMALAHAIENQVEAAYRRGDLLAKRRALMADWAGYCSS